MKLASISLLRLVLILAISLMAPSIAWVENAPESRSQGRTLIAIDKVANKIRFYDPVTLTQTFSIDSPGKTVHELAIAADRRTAAIPLYGDGIYGANPEPNNKVLILDLTTQRLTKVINLGTCRAPHGLAISPDTQLWVLCDQSQSLAQVDLETGEVLASYQTPGKGPHVLAMTNDGERIFISEKEGPLAVFNTRTHRFESSIELRGKPGTGSEGLAISPDQTRLVTVDNDLGKLHLINLASRREIGQFTLLSAPPTNPRRSRLMKLAFSPDGRQLVVTGYAGGLAWIIDGHNLHHQVAVPVAKGPQAIAFTPDGLSVLVSSHDDGLITRINLKSNSPDLAVDGGGGIEVLAFY